MRISKLITALGAGMASATSVYFPSNQINPPDLGSLECVPNNESNPSFPGTQVCTDSNHTISQISANGRQVYTITNPAQATADSSNTPESDGSIPGICISLDPNSTREDFCTNQNILYNNTYHGNSGFLGSSGVDVLYVYPNQSAAGFNLNPNPYQGQIYCNELKPLNEQCIQDIHDGKPGASLTLGAPITKDATIPSTSAVSTQATSSSTSSLPTNSQTHASPGNSPSSGLSPGAITGISTSIAGSLIGLAATLAYKHRNDQRKAKIAADIRSGRIPLQAPMDVERGR